MARLDIFKRAEGEYDGLRGQLRAGRLTPEQFAAALDALMVDYDGRYWQIGAESGKWYVHDGRGWVETTPPQVSDASPPGDLQLRVPGRLPTVPPGRETPRALNRGPAPVGTSAAAAFTSAQDAATLAPKAKHRRTWVWVAAIGAGVFAASMWWAQNLTNVRQTAALPDVAVTVTAGTPGSVCPSLPPAPSLGPAAFKEYSVACPTAIGALAASSVTTAQTTAGPKAAPRTAVPAEATLVGTTNAATMVGSAPAACGLAVGSGVYGKWIQMGAERGALGCPIAGEAPANSPQGTAGTYVEFATGDGGVIIWHRTGHLAGQAFEVHGCIFKVYKSLGKGTSWLGFPISDEYTVPDGRRSDFEGGYVVWSAQTSSCQAFSSQAASTSTAPSGATATPVASRP